MNISQNEMKRSAGILIHISSLPGRYPCGDLGPEAFKFVRKLKKAEQKYWQILPLNPLDSTKGFSPYSPLSAFAGNALFISPEKLHAEGFLEKLRLPDTANKGSKVNYPLAQIIKEEILHESFQQFRENPPENHKHSLDAFTSREAHWLDDFTLYISLRKKLKLPWYDWPAHLRDREVTALRSSAKDLKEEIEFEKYVQFLFTLQWTNLKQYCHKNGIKIIGDIPIYISHDSADVWAHPEYFRLTASKAIAKNAGVPPDYFNDKGQLWNMPVYNWKQLEKTGYKWWIERLTKNLELYDIVRLDHFRGFSSYWEVNGKDQDATGGKWIKGPAEKLFNVIQKAFPSMPFIAEDLGDVDQPVFDLRDKYGLPGMRILQFAFEGNMPTSIFIPHNYTPNSVVYTGTHDNNTVKGWYAGELSSRGRKNLSKYMDKAVNKQNAHRILIESAYKSVAETAVIPMQDILGLGVRHRMNFPSTEKGNWLWRMRRGEFDKNEMKSLKKLVRLSGRNYGSSE